MFLWYNNKMNRRNFLKSAAIAAVPPLLSGVREPGWEIEPLAWGAGSHDVAGDIRRMESKMFTSFNPPRCIFVNFDDERLLIENGVNLSQLFPGVQVVATGRRSGMTNPLG